MSSPTTRERIVDAALRLLDEGGVDAMSTRAVGAAAGVQAPTIYRLFEDKQGLLDAVTERRFAEYVEQKTTREHAEDPVEDLRRGWDLHVGFGLANPAAYVAIYGTPRPGGPSPAVQRSTEILLGMLRRIAAAGRLRVDEHTAAQLVHAAGLGVTLVLISTPAAERDPRFADVAREAAIAAVTTDPPADVPGAPLPAAARTLRAALPAVDVLSPGEKVLMGEWLDRIGPPGD
ncbi:TetR/AcrR family transcriptional regulator [Modestobacter roseus]|uniref:TetR family transcriptional regulator n=1 Tax=Modestobacter roseus TaxID=1181884 RepID=A0A562IXC5_9ACTN|nr:TetR/AcrR family transcriptional regulator [Modestobacter roseus]MQA34902.1 TetR family transcriptional regulator [Modestobacter roseus]TWH75214.1 TetR family transcriptional regulator [Modestobacter roseus]